MISAVSSAGIVNVNVAYAPYGETVESQQPAGAAGTAVGIAAHRRRMNDKYVDEIGSLAYYGARYYDNVLIGWTQGDPMYRFAPDAAWKNPRRANLYQFTLSNPVRYVDPDGRDAQKTYQVQFSDLTLPDSTMNLAEARTAVIRAIEALPNGRVNRELKKNGVTMSGPSRGDAAIDNDHHSNIVLIDASSEEQRQAASKVNWRQRDNVDTLKNDPRALAATYISGTDITVALDRIQAKIDKINSRSDLSDEQKAAAVRALAANVVEHEVMHDLGLGHNKESGNQKNLMDAEVTPYPWADITKDESDAIKRDLERRKFWDGY
jgi:RHS repeat-associated protein